MTETENRKKRLKILTVCGAGVGTSTLLRMNIKSVLDDLHLPVPVDVENTSLSRARGSRCDLIVTFESFREEAEKTCPNVITIKNLMDKQELHTKLEAFFKENQYL